MSEVVIVMVMATVAMGFGAVIVWGVLLVVERLLEVRTYSHAVAMGPDEKAIRRYLKEIEELRKHGVEAE